MPMTTVCPPSIHASLMRILMLAALASLPLCARAAAHLCVSNAQLSFGDRPVGSSTTAASSLANCGDSPLVLSELSSDPASSPEFTFGGSCATGMVLAPSASCAVSVTFSPTVAGQVSGGIVENGGSGDLLVYYGRGVDSRTGTASLVFNPAAVVFPPQRVGTASAPSVVTVTNNGTRTLTFSALVQNGPAAYDFPAAPDSTWCAVGASLGPGLSCRMAFVFQPQALGTRRANLNIDAPELASLAILQLAVPARAPRRPWT